jgi:hypothetical protein
MLRVNDKIGFFDRSDGIHPFLILDGHGSRFKLVFLGVLTTRKASV